MPTAIRRTPARPSGPGSTGPAARRATAAAEPRALRIARWGVPFGALLALIAVVLATVVSRAGLVDLLDAGALVRWGDPTVTVLAELAAAVTLGALVLAAFVLPRTGGRTVADGAAWTATVRVAANAAAAWTVLALAEAVLTYGTVAGVRLDDPSFGPGLGLYLTSISLGRIQLAVVVIAALTSVATLLVRGPVGALWTGLLAASALALLSQTGHASGDVSHELAISTMFLHLLAAAVWIGGLGALALVAHRLGRDLAPAVARYSAIALWSYLGVAVSGVVNAALRMDTLADLGTTYGLLVVAKTALLLGLGVIGWVHRRSVVPRLVSATPGRAPWLFWRLVVVELGIMGAVSGVAVALASSDPPADLTPTGVLSPAQVVTGHELPVAPTADQWFTGFRWDLLFALAALSAAVVYLRWVRRLARRGDPWPLGRTVSGLVGLLVFAWATSGGPAVYGHVLLSAHMIEHMVLMLIVPIFLVLSAPVTLASRALPVRTDGSRGPREWLLGLVHSRWAGVFSLPIVAAVNFAGSMYVFYFTELFRYSLETYIGHVGMVLHFSLAGYLFLNGLIGIDPGPKRPAYPLRLVLLFATMAFHAFFGIALMMDDALLVPDWFGLLGRTWGPSALDDQRIAGEIVWGISEIPMLVVAIVLAVAWTRADERTARRTDRAADRDGDAELEAYNAMLARAAERDAREDGRR
ncbi:cytochrome c oxidase assembly protein [Actinotalea sp.]|uniref:cytochrome c oxidase assembly protein n=1 Tax=Actinotalea sp. TaxID=1872145 RepID=UPI00356A11A9